MKFIPSQLLKGGFAALDAQRLGATTPQPRSTGELLADPQAVERMGAAFDQQIQRNTGGKRSAKDVLVEPPYLNTPVSPEEVLANVLDGKSGLYASNRLDPTTGHHEININPNLEDAAFMHELGHVAARQGRVGSFVRSVRDNPKLMKALSQAAFIAPMGLAALIPGDDDLAASIAASAFLSSPKLIDEALATKDGLSMMKSMGRPASGGQRARLAGDYMSYLISPVLSGLSGNFAGNLMDVELTSRLGYG